MLTLGVRVEAGEGFQVSGFGFRVSGWGFGFRVQGPGFRVQGSGFRGSGSGFRLQDFEVERERARARGSEDRVLDGPASKKGLQG